MITSFFEGISIFVVLVVTLIVALRIGQHVGRRARTAGMEITKGTGTVEGGVLGLLALILAFTFFNQENRFELRIDLNVEEINAIATAYDQALVLKEPARSEIRALIRAYRDAFEHAARTRDFHEGDDPLRRRGTELYQAIWEKTMVACEDIDRQYCSNLLLPSINKLEQVSLAVLVARQTHTPRLVMLLVLVLSTCGSALSGFSTAAQEPKRMRGHMLAYIIALAFTYYTIVDLEYPRWGLIKVWPALDPAFAELNFRLM